MSRLISLICLLYLIGVLFISILQFVLNYYKPYDRDEISYILKASIVSFKVEIAGRRRNTIVKYVKLIAVYY